MTNLRELVEKYGDERANDVPSDFNGNVSYRNGFTAALELLWPCVEDLYDLTECHCDEAYKSRGRRDPSCNCIDRDTINAIKAKVGAE